MSETMKFLEGGYKSNQLSINADIQKDTGQERIVVGFATLNNVDLTNEMITEEANLKAFSKFRGNVRLMHEKKPVGRVLEYAPATYYDEETQKEYTGIKVAVRVSKGADDAWEMCTDGTLSGFSIGGTILKAAQEFNESLNKHIRVITEYQLLELSLVDSPANHLANVETVYKSVDGAQENTRFQSGGDFTKVFQLESKGDNSQMSDVVETPAEVAEVTETETAVVEEVAVVEEEVAEEAVVEVEKTERPELEEMILKLGEQIAAQNKDVSEAVAKELGESIDSQLSEVQKAFESRFSDIEKRVDGPIADLVTKVNQLEEGIKETAKALDSINSASAMQKSLEAETPKAIVEENKSTFSGVFSDKYE